MGESRKPDCILCRVMGTVYGVGAGTYIALHAPAQGPKRVGMLLLASALGALGLARGFNLPPFGGMFRASESEDIQQQR